MQSITISLDLKTQPRKDGLHALRLRVTIDGESKWITLNEFIDKKYWDAKKKQVKAGQNNSLKINTFLNREKGRIQDIILDLKKDNPKLSLELIELAYKHQDTYEYLINSRMEVTPDIITTIIKTGKTFLSICDYIDTQLLIDKSTITEGTYNLYRMFLRIMRLYAANTDIKSIDIEWVKRFDIWLMEERKQSRNSRNNYHILLRKYLRRAHKKGLVKQYPYTEFQIKIKEVEKDILSFDEVLYLYDTSMIVKNNYQDIPYYLVSYFVLIRTAIDLAIISAIENALKHIYYFTALLTLQKKDRISIQIITFICYVGLRCVDLKRLHRNHIINNTIYIPQRKGGEFVTIPLTPEAKSLMTDSDGLIFPTLTIDRATDLYNRRIKKIVKLLGINKYITMHSGRRTFGTLATCFNIPPKVVQMLLGHKDERSTKPYVRIGNHILSEQMKKFGKKPDA